MRKLKWVILPLILGGYSLLYMATSYEKECIGECDKLLHLHETLSSNREHYFYGVHRCTYPQQSSDTLCVYVKDTLGIDWNLFADTVCQAATNNGLPGQSIFILNQSIFPPDTLARKVCP
jgi:hypothetical protein